VNGARPGSAAPELVSVLIATHNRAHCLDELLRRLFDLFDGEHFEVLVFDDASTDETPAVCARYGKKIRAWRSPRNLGYIEARRRMIAEARGAFLASLDDDSCFIDRHALATIREVFRTHPHCGVIAANIASPGTPGGMVPATGVPVPTGGFIGCGHVLRADAVQNAGGYPDFLAAYGAEETLLALRMLDAGYDLLMVPSLRVYHAQDPTQRPTVARRATVLLNELATVLYLYPLRLVLPGLGRKVLGHLRYNLHERSVVALWLALEQLPFVVRRAVRHRRPVRAATVRALATLRRQSLARAQGASDDRRWPEVDTMFGPAAAADYPRA
jgi:glycosyltransferase involved in cell wall biosynthesis